jgi:hypothetical protein
MGSRNAVGLLQVGRIICHAKHRTTQICYFQAYTDIIS